MTIEITNQVRIQNYPDYWYTVEDTYLDVGCEGFTISYWEDVYEIIEEAVKLFYFGKSGWKEGWPLTFVIYDSRGKSIARAYVFVMCSTPTFDVILAS
jgi:hypothetical protein